MITHVFFCLDIYHEGKDGFSYKVHRKQFSWADAHAKCAAEGAQLAIVDSKATFKYIDKAFAIHHPLWLGGRNINSKYALIIFNVKSSDPLDVLQD